MANSLIGIQFRAQLENVTGLRPQDDEFKWHLKLKCVSCKHVPEHWQYVTQTPSLALRGNLECATPPRRRANSVIKCKMCKMERSIDVVGESVTSYDAGDSGSFKTIVVFNCHGMEPVDFSPGKDWTCFGFKAASADEKGRKGCTFNHIDLCEGDGDFVDYDSVIQESIMVSEIEYQIIRIKRNQRTLKTCYLNN